MTENNNLENLTEEASQVGLLVRPLTWHDWDMDKNKVPDNIPINETLIVEIESYSKQKEFHLASFFLDGNNKKLGTVGHHFYFDVEIKRWASIQYLIEV